MVTSVWKTSVCFIGPHWQVHDMRRTKPTLFRVLQLCITEEEGKDIVTALIGGVILKQHNERMTFLQRLFSILLSSNYSPKQVYYYIIIIADYYFFFNFSENYRSLESVCLIRVQKDTLIFFVQILMNRL